MAISPDGAIVAPNEQVQFSFAGGGANPQWGCDYGSIDANGLYTASASPGSSSFTVYYSDDDFNSDDATGELLPASFTIYSGGNTVGVVGSALYCETNWFASDGVWDFVDDGGIAAIDSSDQMMATLSFSGPGTFTLRYKSTSHPTILGTLTLSVIAPYTATVPLVFDYRENGRQLSLGQFINGSPTAWWVNSSGVTNSSGVASINSSTGVVTQAIGYPETVTLTVIAECGGNNAASLTFSVVFFTPYPIERHSSYSPNAGTLLPGNTMLVSSSCILIPMGLFAIDTQTVWTVMSGGGSFLSYGPNPPNYQMAEYQAPATPGEVVVRVAVSEDFPDIYQEVTLTIVPTLELTPASATIGYGETLQFAATEGYTDLDWINYGLGNLTQDGLYTAPSEDTTTWIEASDPGTGQMDSSQVDVTSTGATIDVTPDTDACETGEQIQFTANLTVVSPPVTWSCSGGSVDSAGLWTAPAGAGTYYVTARHDATGLTDTSSVEVTAAPTVTVTVTPETGSVRRAGTFQLSAEVEGATDPSVTWEASAGSIDANGLFTAPMDLGPVTITATSVEDGTASDTAEITVRLPTGAVVLDVSDVHQWIYHASRQPWPIGGGSGVYGQGVFRATYSGEILDDPDPGYAQEISDGVITFGPSMSEPDGWDHPNSPVAAWGLNNPLVVGTLTITVSADANPDITDTAEVEIILPTLSLVPAGDRQLDLNADSNLGMSAFYQALVSGLTFYDLELFGDYDIPTWNTMLGTGFVSVWVHPLFHQALIGMVDHVGVRVSWMPEISVGPYAVTVVGSADLRLDPPNATLAPEATVDLTAIFAVADPAGVTWGVSAGSVNSTGTHTATVTAPATAGFVVVTATSVTDSGVTATALLRVTSETATLVVSPPTPTASVGDQIQFSAVLDGADGTVIWGANYGTIDANGLYTAPDVEQEVDLTIFAFLDIDPTVVGTATVTAGPRGITVSPATADTYPGDTVQFTADLINPADTVTWEVSGGGSIDANGLFTADSVGTFTVTATIVENTDYFDTGEVTVALPTGTVTITPDPAELETGETLQLVAALDGELATATPEGVTWSKTSGIGSIGESGLYSAPIVPGEAVIRATSQANPAIYDEVTVTVAQGPVVITMSPASAVLDYNEALEITTEEGHSLDWQVREGSTVLVRIYAATSITFTAPNRPGQFAIIGTHPGTGTTEQVPIFVDEPTNPAEDPGDLKNISGEIRVLLSRDGATSIPLRRGQAISSADFPEIAYASVAARQVARGLQRNVSLGLIAGGARQASSLVAGAAPLPRSSAPLMSITLELQADGGTSLSRGLDTVLGQSFTDLEVLIDPEQVEQFGLQSSLSPYLRLDSRIRLATQPRGDIQLTYPVEGAWDRWHLANLLQGGRQRNLTGHIARCHGCSDSGVTLVVPPSLRRQADLLLRFVSPHREATLALDTDPAPAGPVHLFYAGQPEEYLDQLDHDHLLVTELSPLVPWEREAAHLARAWGDAATTGYVPLPVVSAHEGFLQPLLPSGPESVVAGSLDDEADILVWLQVVDQAARRNLPLRFALALDHPLNSDLLRIATTLQCAGAMLHLFAEPTPAALSALYRQSAVLLHVDRLGLNSTPVLEAQLTGSPIVSLSAPLAPSLTEVGVRAVDPRRAVDALLGALSQSLPLPLWKKIQYRHSARRVASFYVPLYRSICQ